MGDVRLVKEIMDSSWITAIATALLVIVGYVQLAVLKAQRRQSRLDSIEKYRKWWAECSSSWATVIFIGRDIGEYYQVVDRDTVGALSAAVESARLDSPTVWALDSTRSVFSVWSDICIRLLNGQLDIANVYPIFGTQILRHSRPLRVLLDVDYDGLGISMDTKHLQVRREVQDWLIYHDGVRRRCLILIDLMWAEAVRLEDLPPDDIRSAADAKSTSGKSSRLRLIRESIRLNGLNHLPDACRLSMHLRHSEYRHRFHCMGVNKKKLYTRDKEWTGRLLRDKKN